MIDQKRNAVGNTDPGDQFGSWRGTCSRDNLMKFGGLGTEVGPGAFGFLYRNAAFCQETFYGLAVSPDVSVAHSAVLQHPYTSQLRQMAIVEMAPATSAGWRVYQFLTHVVSNCSLGEPRQVGKLGSVKSIVVCRRHANLLTVQCLIVNCHITKRGWVSLCAS